MKIQIEKYEADIGITCIENLFFSLYMPQAGEKELKVYLYLFRLAQDATMSEKMDKEDISKLLNLSEQEIDEALRYWLKLGIIKKSKDLNTGEDVLSFISLNELYFEKKQLAQYEEDQNTISLKDTKFKEMVHSIEDLIHMELTRAELERLKEYLLEYNQTEDLIVMAYQYCISSQNKKTLSYVLAVLRNWYIEGIQNTEDWLKYHERIENQKSQTRKKRTYHKTRSTKSAQDDSHDELLSEMRKQFGDDDED